nr:MAG TPA: hypothetical protein [Caudoviricetes sp.]
MGYFLEERQRKCRENANDTKNLTPNMAYIW